MFYAKKFCWNSFSAHPFLCLSSAPNKISKNHLVYNIFNGVNLLKTAKKCLGRMESYDEKKEWLCDHSLYKCFHILLYFIHIVNSNKVWNIRHMLNRLCFICDYCEETKT